MGHITNVARDDQEGQSAKTVGPASQRSLTWICLKAGWDWEAKEKGRDNPGGGRGGVGWEEQGMPTTKALSFQPCFPGTGLTSQRQGVEFALLRHVCKGRV